MNPRSASARLHASASANNLSTLTFRRLPLGLLPPEPRFLLPAFLLGLPLPPCDPVLPGFVDQREEDLVDPILDAPVCCVLRVRAVDVVTAAVDDELPCRQVLPARGEEVGRPVGRLALLPVPLAQPEGDILAAQHRERLVPAQSPDRPHLDPPADALDRLQQGVQEPQRPRHVVLTDRDFHQQVTVPRGRDEVVRVRGDVFDGLLLSWVGNAADISLLPTHAQAARPPVFEPRPEEVEILTRLLDSHMKQLNLVRVGLQAGFAVLIDNREMASPFDVDASMPYIEEVQRLAQHGLLVNPPK